MTIGVAYARPADFNLEYPPNYKINTDVTLTCQAEGASGNVKYQWLSTAERDLPANSNSQNLTKTMLNSYDTGNYTCMAMDANSNIGSATTEMKVIGESFENLHCENSENKFFSTKDYISLYRYLL